MSSYCRNCGCLISDNALYCSNCGMARAVLQPAHKMTDNYPPPINNRSRHMRSTKLVISVVAVICAFTVATIFLVFSQYSNSHINGYWYGHHTVIFFDTWQRVVINFPSKTIEGKYTFSPDNKSGTITTEYERICFILKNGTIDLPGIEPLTKDQTTAILFSPQSETTAATIHTEKTSANDSFQDSLTKHEWIYHSTIQSTPDMNIPELYDISPDPVTKHAFTNTGTLVHSVYDQDSGKQVSSTSIEYEINDVTAMAYWREYEFNNQLYELFYSYHLGPDGLLREQLMLHDTFTDEFFSISNICMFEPAVQ